MNLLERTISSIKVPRMQLSSSVFPVFAAQSIQFSKLMTALLRYINITGERHPAPPQTSVIISCADHGVAAESVSAYPPETTLNMMCNYLIARRRKLCECKPYRCRPWCEYGAHRHTETFTSQHCTRNSKYDQRACYDTRTGNPIHRNGHCHRK